MTKSSIIRSIGITVAIAATIVAAMAGSYAVSSVALAVGIGAVAALAVLDRAFPEPLMIALLLVFFLPFERIPSVDVAGVSLRISQFLGLLGIIVIALKVAFERWRFRPYPAALWLIPFFAAALIGVTQAFNLEEAIKAFGFSLFTVLVSVVVVQLVRTKRDLERVVAWLLPSVIIVVLFALYQTAGNIVGLPLTILGLEQGYSKAVNGFPRPQAFSVEPLYLADYLFVPLGVFGALWLGKIRGWNRTLVGATIVGIVLVIILTVSRGGYLGLLPFTLVFLLFYPGRTVTVRSIGWFVIVAAIVGASTVGFLTYSKPGALQDFIAHATVQDLNNGQSTQGRLMAFGQAIQAWETKPVIGIGMGNFGPYVANYPNPATVTGWDIVNNEYLEILAETGVVGFIFMALFVLALLWRHIRALVQSTDPFERAILVGLLATFAGVLTQYNFFSTLYILPIWVLVGLMVAAQNVVLAPEVHAEKKQKV